jgi:hypothetical protein
MVCLTPGRLANILPDTAVNTQNPRLKTIRTGKTVKVRKYVRSNFADDPNGRSFPPGRGIESTPKILSNISTVTIVDTIVQVYNSAFPLYAATVKKYSVLVPILPYSLGHKFQN